MPNENQPPWLQDYKRKLTSPEIAVRAIESGASVYVQSNAAAPECLTSALVNRAHELKGVKIYHLLTLGKADYAKPDYADSFRVQALFIGANVREAVNCGRADYVPAFLSEIPALFIDGQIPLDVCLLQVSPPDKHGFCSYGVSVDCTIAARKQAKCVIAEINKQMPRTLGRSLVHVSRFDHIVETDHPLPELTADQPSLVEDAIGRHVASLVEDGATLQLGIGAVPNAVLRYLKDKKDLGIHSEMLSDGVIDLIESGVITNDCKTLLPGQVAVSFVMGTKRLYDFVDNNPMIEFQPSDFINDPFIIAKNIKMTSINSALQVDLTGQVSADSIGTHLYSGVGGQVDFIRGANHAPGGKAIIAIPSTAKSDTISRIVSKLSHGAGIVTTRADVRYIVTEYGICDLHGKSMKQRAQALIDIAHPDFRTKLLAETQEIPWLK